ncbi:putative glycosyltransferase 7 [Acorus gramineus]|uniref:Glycosyltransferase 7 n=1 Tax=Acorus gramineus TaxID=55184 RepID=A0AAV9AWV3_ACOGR|nr:putative glycosyltransferase 7 [Acorus gramineus]
MVTPETEMAKSPSRTRHPSSSSFLTETLLFSGGALVAFLLLWTAWSFSNTTTTTFTFEPSLSPKQCHPPNRHHDPPYQTFYDDPNLSYSIDGPPITDWDAKRRRWLALHPTFQSRPDQVLLVSGSQPKPCRNPMGDHLLLRFLKNKIDYSRIHGFQIFYNNALFHPKMGTFWAKLPLIRSAMIAHPESEWIYWVDSDAAFTDMEFDIPFDKYRNHNLIVHGWSHLIYENRTWVGLNAGIFLIRNCQWSMEFINVWASMGPISPKYKEWGKIQKSVFKDKAFPESDDQTALAYLILKEKEKWADKIYLESEYYFEGYWVEIVGRLVGIGERYLEVERGEGREGLRRRRAEVVAAGAAAGEREGWVKEAGGGRGGLRRPFITHFAGCQPCSGDHNAMYSGENCWEGMRTALDFADDQVLRSFGFRHVDVGNDSGVVGLPFDYPNKA